MTLDGGAAPAIGVAYSGYTPTLLREHGHAVEYVEVPYELLRHNPSVIEIGAYATISWNVVFMDSYRLPFDPTARRELLQRSGASAAWSLCAAPSRPIRLHDNVWIGFDVCVLPGVTIGEGSIVGARSVVTADVPAYTVVAGNPARVIRELPRTAPGSEP